MDYVGSTKMHMDNYYITETTTSIEDFSKSLEALMPGSIVNSHELNNKFKSYGEGIISDNFYIGNNVTVAIDDIEVHNFTSCMLTIPRSGKYSTQVSNETFHHIAGKSGGIVLPVDRIFYEAETYAIDDLTIVIGMEDLKLILKKNYGIASITTKYISLDLTKAKVSSVSYFIESTIQTARNFPHLGESLLVKSNIKEIATLFIADLIADSLNVYPITHISRDLTLVQNTEAFIESEYKKLLTIQEIANQLSTIPRSLQKAFKKYRNYTPLQYLRKQKIYQAHKLLIDINDPNRSVKKAAFNVGLFDLSRFSRYYREVYGELPSKTIEKASK